MPIRTGLDERMTQIRLDLKEYFGEAKDAYSEAIEAFTKMTQKCMTKLNRFGSMHELEIGIYQTICC